MKTIIKCVRGVGAGVVLMMAGDVWAEPVQPTFDIIQFSTRFVDKTVTLSTTHIEVGKVVRAIAKQAGLNVVLSEDIKGSVTTVLKDINPIQALNGVLETKGYSWFPQNENTIVITTNKIAHAFPLQHSNAEDVAKTLEKMVGGAASISFHAGSNSVVVEGSSAMVFKINQAIKTIDVISKQVWVEAKIIELSVGNTSNMGLIASYGGLSAKAKFSTVNLAKNNFGATTPDKEFGLLTTFAHSGFNLTAALNALQARKDFNLKASPRVLATNNQKAEILVGEKIGYKTTTLSSTGTATETIQFLDVGIRLIFTPRISDSGYVSMTIHPEVSTGTLSAANVPNTKTTEATTHVVVKNGETLVIGGLISEQDEVKNNGVPFLKDLPIIGMAFRNKNADLQKREIIVFLTPKIVDEQVRQTSAQEADEFDNRYQKDKRSPAEILF
jgi:type II secretory pathway component GspD/PulD (secretin)